jgi:hypothetical protein
MTNIHPHEHTYYKTTHMPIPVKGCPVCEANTKFCREIAKSPNTRVRKQIEKEYEKAMRPWKLHAGIDSSYSASNIERYNAKRLYEKWWAKLNLGGK